MSISSLLKVKAIRVLLPAIAAMIAYGNWAYFVNKDTDNAYLSAISESLRAFTFTTIGNLFTELVWSFYSFIKSQGFRLLSSSLSVWFIMQSVAFSIHWSINPSTALTTILPGMMISSVYVVLYLSALAKIQGKVEKVK